MWNLPPTRDWTRAPCIGSTESQSLDHQSCFKHLDSHFPHNFLPQKVEENNSRLSPTHPPLRSCISKSLIIVGMVSDVGVIRCSGDIKCHFSPSLTGPVNPEFILGSQPLTVPQYVGRGLLLPTSKGSAAFLIFVHGGHLREACILEIASCVWFNTWFFVARVCAGLALHSRC